MEQCQAKGLPVRVLLGVWGRCHWQVEREPVFAALGGVQNARVHAICTQNLGKQKGVARNRVTP
jgi:hypothetical protein